MDRADIGPLDTDDLFKLATYSFRSLHGQPNSVVVGQEMLKERGRSFLNGVRARLAKGLRGQVDPFVESLAALAHTAPDASAPILLGFDAQVNRLIGNGDASQKELESALAKAHKSLAIVQESEALRVIADAPGIYRNDRVQSAIANMIAATDKAPNASGAEVLVNLGILAARNGDEPTLQSILGRLSALGKANPDLAIHEQRLRGLSEIALAWHAQQTNDFAMLESHLRQTVRLLS
jgi:hypothetical protein